MRAATVADKLVEVLEQVGVRRVYGVVGDSLNPVVDAIRRSERIGWIPVRNEEAGAFAASAEAQLTGRLAVCAGSCGPGNTHLLQGVYDAHRSRAPVLVIASHITSEEVGTSFFQETHPERLFVDASSFCEVLSTAEQAPRLVQIAVQHALAAEDASVLVLPGDVAERHAPEIPVRPVPFSEASRAELIPPPEVIEALAEQLDAAERVTLFCGAGVRGAHDEVMRLAGKLFAPVGHSLRGKEWIQFDNPFDVGMTGLLGYGACYDAMGEADLLVLLGTDFPYDAFLPEVRTIQVDRDATHLGRRSPLVLAVHGDVAPTLRAVEPLVRQKRDRRFLDAMLRRHAEALERVVGAYVHDIEHRRPIHPEWVAAVLDDVAADDAIFTVDTGMCNVWAARYLTPNGRRRVIGSFVHGSMANALPQAIGAQLADPGRQVISVSGDGGLGMLLRELLTLRQHDLPVKVVLFNNGSLGMVKLEMLVAGFPDHGTDTGQFDYAAIARAIGLEAMRVEDPTRVRPALEHALSAPGPVLVDVVTDPNALSIPPRVTPAQLKGGLCLGHGSHGPRWRRREDARPGAGQSAQHPSAVTPVESSDALPRKSSRPTRPLFVVDAFADRPFGGNPAGVVDVGDPDTVDDDWMASVAAELGFSETAFVASLPGHRFSLRWLTPSTEVDLCGHATLGAAQALLERGEPPPLRFETRSGALVVEPTDDGRLAMRFPTAAVQAIERPPGLADALGAEPSWVGQGELGDLVVVLTDEACVRALRPDLEGIRALGGRAVVVTAAAPPGSPYDFVSRVFAPNVGVAEDPVTGSAHCELAAVWSQRLGRRSLVGYQASARTGTIGIELHDHHVLLTGRALVVVQGEVRAPGARKVGAEPAGPTGEAPTVILVRHGQTALNAAGALRGRLDPPLDELGQRQADALGAALRSLPIREVRSSPLRRTRQSAEPIARHHRLSVVDDERLADRDWGPFAGQAEAEVRARFGSLDDLPGAEPRDAVRRRAEAVFAEAAARAAPGEIVVLVTHDALIRELLSTRLPWPSAPELVPQRTGSWNAVVRRGGRWLAALVDQQPEADPATSPGR